MRYTTAIAVTTASMSLAYQVTIRQWDAQLAASRSMNVNSIFNTPPKQVTINEMNSS